MLYGGPPANDTKSTFLIQSLTQREGNDQYANKNRMGPVCISTREQYKLWEEIER